MGKNYREIWVGDETAALACVLLGTAAGFGRPPAQGDTYDPRSRESLQKGIYPSRDDLARELAQLKNLFEKYGVTVLQPPVLPNTNQVFVRDAAFVIEDKFVRSNIIPDRQRELDALQGLIPQIEPHDYIVPPVAVHIEGGDVIVWHDHLFVGVYTGPDYAGLSTARTNAAAPHFLRETFPHKTVKPFELVKSNIDPRKNVLHLDCAFQPVGKDKAILYRDGFLNERDYFYLVDYFGAENIFEVTAVEAYHLATNVFSITPELVVVEQNCKRLKRHMETRWNLQVEAVPYGEVAKIGGLLRCTTLPLKRKKATTQK